METNINKEDDMNDKDFLELRNGGDFNKFFRRTKKEWDNLANKVMLTIDHPHWIELEDITQHMAMACLKAVKDWDSTKTPSIKTHVIWNCMEAARKYLHHFRNSKGPKREGPPRYEINFSSFSREQAECFLDYKGVPANQEHILNAKEFVHKNDFNYNFVMALLNDKSPRKFLKNTQYKKTKKRFLEHAYDQVTGV